MARRLLVRSSPKHSTNRQRGSVVHSSRRRLVRKITFAGLSLGAVAQACDGSEAERLAAAHYADHCSLDSDCDGGLVCVFTYCHVECNEDKDCSKYGGRCVRVPADDAEKSTTIGVCQLNEEASCGDGKPDCKGEQVCAADGPCRDQCSSSNLCFSGFTCAVSGECALSSELDSGGGLWIPPGTGMGGATGTGGAHSTSGGTLDPGSNGSGGDGGAGDASTSGGNGNGGKTNGGSTSGGTAATGGKGSSAGDSSMAGGGATGTDGGADGAGGAAGGGPGDGYIEGTNEPEPVNNNDRDHALPLPTHGSLWLPTSDEDWFYIYAPDDGRAHVIELFVQQNVNARAYVTAFAALDNSLMGTFLVPDSESRSVFITVGPGTRTNIGFLGNRPGRVNFDVLSVTAERDEYEPNNDRYTAKPVELNTSIIGQQIIPYTNASGPDNADWFQLTMAAGAAVINVVEAPANVGFSFAMMDETNANTPLKKLAPGVIGPVPITIPKAGVYRFELTHHSNSYLDDFYGGVKPESLYKTYTVRFEQ
jgi:hypothetical protein